MSVTQLSSSLVWCLPTTLISVPYHYTLSLSPTTQGPYLTPPVPHLPLTVHTLHPQSLTYHSRSIPYTLSPSPTIHGPYHTPLVSHLLLTVHTLHLQSLLPLKVLPYTSSLTYHSRSYLTPPVPHLPLKVLPYTPSPSPTIHGPYLTPLVSHLQLTVHTLHLQSLTYNSWSLPYTHSLSPTTHGPYLTHFQSLTYHSWSLPYTLSLSPHVLYMVDTFATLHTTITAINFKPCGGWAIYFGVLGDWWQGHEFDSLCGRNSFQLHLV